MKTGTIHSSSKNTLHISRTEEPQKALVKLAELGAYGKTVIMCFEYSVEKCHRRIIKERLISDGFGVVDL